MARESLLIATLVELADNLVDHYDVIDVLTVLSDRCVEAVDVDAAGVMLASPGGELQYVASSSETMRILELFQVQANEGPCIDCFRDGHAIINHSLADSHDRWPNFTPRALAQGFQSVHCLPMRLRGRTIGALNLFRTLQGPLGDDDVAVAQGLADVATVAILQHRSSVDADTLNDQLSSALNSRIIIEQAKGIVSQSTSCDMDEAFSRLRAQARNHNEGLTDVAFRIVHGTLPVADLDLPKNTAAK
ncbi:MAG TPA: GAF and ANTAR domain-containing protein [Acidimicrobiales bacterium]|nr:GAF and ANTAR domain-containing protein [Acidimicrobiales bacterium]